MNTHTFLKLAITPLAFGLSVPLVHGAVYSHYTFDTDYTDSSGNARHGTLTDVGTIGNTVIKSTVGDFKFGGGAVDFSDERDYVALPTVSFGSGTPYSISFWAQVDSVSRTWNMAIGQRDGGTHDTGFFIAPNGAEDNLRWRSFNNDGNAVEASRQADFDTGVNDTAWHHYVITGDSSGNIVAYLDGSVVSTDGGNQTGFIVDTIGAAYKASSGLDFRGRMDEVWIFDETIDATTVGHLYDTNTTVAVPEPSAAALIGLGGLALILRRRK